MMERIINPMNVLPFDASHENEGVEAASKAIADGGLVVFPTETCYGVGADATNVTAVKKLYTYKGGRKQQATSVAVADRAMAERLVKINETAEHLYEQFLPGPVTVISESKGKVVNVLEAERGTLGIRIPDYPPVLEWIKDMNTPITATSANTSGKKTPYSLEDLKRYTSDTKLSMIDVFLDAGQLSPTPPSTVVDTTLNELMVLREGAVDFSQLETVAHTTTDENETRRLGERLIKRRKPLLSSTPLVFALQGELGAGKTQLVKGLAQGLAIEDTVVSPTYQIMREYPYECGKVSGKLVHIDTWRLGSPEELRDLHVEKLLTAGNVIALE